MLPSLSAAIRGMATAVFEIVAALWLMATGRKSSEANLSFLRDVVERILSGIDVYSGEGNTLRKQLYLSEKALADEQRHAPIYLEEISISELDQYALGGTEAALRQKAGLVATERIPDLGATLALARLHRQRGAYRELVFNAKARAELGLSNYHPQCYFEIRDELDKISQMAPAEQQSFVDSIARRNVSRAVEELLNQSATLADLVRQGRILVVGAMYDVATGDIALLFGRDRRAARAGSATCRAIGPTVRVPQPPGGSTTGTATAPSPT